MSIKTCKGILTPRLLNAVKDIMTELNFKIAFDTNERSKNFLRNENIKLQGLSRITTDQPIGEIETKLNIFAFFIAEKVAEKTKLNYRKINRFMWNIYRPGEEGDFHNDGDEGDYSILYSLNSTDGYLQINDAKFYDVEDEAKVFPSFLKHKGVGPKKNNLRINLNIVLEGCSEK